MSTYRGNASFSGICGTWLGFGFGFRMVHTCPRHHPLTQYLLPPRPLVVVVRLVHTLWISSYPIAHVLHNPSHHRANSFVVGPAVTSNTATISTEDVQLFCSSLRITHGLPGLTRSDSDEWARETNLNVVGSKPQLQVFFVEKVQNTPSNVASLGHSIGGCRWRAVRTAAPRINRGSRCNPSVNFGDTRILCSTVCVIITAGPITKNTSMVGLFCFSSVGVFRALNASSNRKLKSISIHM